MRFAYPSPLVVVSLPQCWLLFLWDALHDDKRHDVWEISCTLSRSLCLSFTASLAVDLFDILQGNALEMISNNGSERDRSGRETERERGT